jgi:hypothetical protein
LQIDLPLLRAVKARKNVNQGGFAAPVWTYQGMNLSWGEIQVYLGKGLKTPKSHAYALRP